MHGFKSFATKTEIPFENAMNVIVGPNGSGKSNITDALCFVLGRISIKSIRAAKAANLIFSGNKTHKPSSEAYVELIFDNSDKIFALESNEVSIKRIVKKNGQGIYKINNETKTRQELLELLAQGGIDPNGFNIVLQGEIAGFVKMSADERRKVIEEVAGISIYETRKHKSIKEFEKTDERLKEVSAILKERGAYLRNLEKERQEALNYQKLETTIKKCKATIIHKNITEKQKQITQIDSQIEEQSKQIQKIKLKTQSKNEQISDLEQKTTKINKQIESSTSSEQTELHSQIADLKAEFAGLSVRKENFETRLNELRERKQEIKKKFQELELEIESIQKSSPKIKEQKGQLKEQQDTFDVLERSRRKFYIIKSDLSTLENKREEKQKTIIELKKESQLIEQNISELYTEIKYEKSTEKSEQLKHKIKSEIQERLQQIEELEKETLEIERQNAGFEQTISKNEKLKGDLDKLETCPLCMNKITASHKEHVTKNADQDINNSKLKKQQNLKKQEEIKIKFQELETNLSNLQTKLNEIEIDLVKIKNSQERKEQLKRLANQRQETEQEITQLNEKITSLRKQFESLKNIEQNYDDARLKLQELSDLDFKLDSDTETKLKQRELNRLKIDFKTTIRETDETGQELKKINSKLQELETNLEKKQEEEQDLYEKFQKLFELKNTLQDQQKAFETDIIGMQHEIRAHEDRTNELKIRKAQIDAQLDSLKFELKDFPNQEPYNLPLQEIQERLNKAQIRISQIGNVNMRALEAYDKIEEQCLQIQEKVETIEKEKEKIQKIIAEIDKKKKKTFVKTLDEVNELFTRNFSQLSRKGEVFLDLENKQDPFEAGLNIIIKVARGKYFDITSLSGGEKTLVALSLIFAIQEYKPYCFYIFDEIDAALDKHNSERLAALIKQHMTSGQYIIVTHNDALISEATTLYGVSMQENISKTISLKI